MTDDEYIADIKKITDPVEMLECVLENEGYYGYDPYYAEMRDAVMLQVKAVLDIKAAPTNE